MIVLARLAQSVEHETLNLRVVGSSPTLGEFCYSFIYFLGAPLYKVGLDDGAAIKCFLTLSRLLLSILIFHSITFMYLVIYGFGFFMHLFNGMQSM